MEHHPVVIIGAGVAGLTCGHYLQKSNTPFLILEASDGVGGRVRTDEVNGFLLDRGFQVFLTSYPEPRKVLDMDALQLKAFRSGAIIRKTNHFFELVNPLKEPLFVLSSLFSPVGTLADKLKIVKLATQVKSVKDEVLFAEPAISTIDFLRNYGWSDKIINQFFKPFFGGVFLERELATSSNFFRFVFKHFAQGDVVLPAGGMKKIPEQISAQLPPQSIRLNTKVAAIADNIIQLENGNAIATDKIVLAVDKSAARVLLTTLQKESAFDKHSFNGTSCLYFAADHSPLQTNMLVINSNEHELINNLCVPSDTSPAYAPSGKVLISVSVVKSHAFSESDLAIKVQQELKGWYGEQVSGWQHLKTYHIPHALPAYPAGQHQQNNIRLNESVYQCGDYTAYPSLNAAILSGRKAAEAVMS